MKKEFYIGLTLAFICSIHAQKITMNSPSDEIIGVISQAQLKAFEGNLIKDGLDSEAIKDWDKIANDAISFALQRTNDQTLKQGINQLPDISSFIQLSISYLHGIYPRIDKRTRDQNIQSITQERKKSLDLENQAYQVLIQPLQNKQQTQWRKTVPESTADILSTEQQIFFDAYYAQAKQGFLPDQTIINLLSNAKVIDPKKSKFKNLDAAHDLMNNLARYAYFSSDPEKIASAKQAEQQLRLIYGATREATQTIVDSQNTSAVTLYKLAGTYEEVLKKLIRELKAMG